MSEQSDRDAPPLDVLKMHYDSAYDGWRIAKAAEEQALSEMVEARDAYIKAVVADAASSHLSDAR